MQPAPACSRSRYTLPLLHGASAKLLLSSPPGAGRNDVNVKSVQFAKSSRMRRRIASSGSRPMAAWIFSCI